MPTTPAPAPAPVKPAPPAEPSLAGMLYGSEPDPVTASLEAASPSPVETPKETDPSSTPEPASTTPVPEEDPTAASEPEPAPTGTEAEAGATDDTPAEKQLADQRAANRRLGRDVADLREGQKKLAEENRILLAKLRGDYEEPAKPTPEQAADEARFKERERISRKVAETLFGPEVMKTRVYGDEATGEVPELATLIADERKSNPYQISPTSYAILLAEEPAVKAMRILQTNDFRATYGDDPTKWVEKVIAHAKPKILAELKKQLAAAQLTGGQPRSVSEGRTAGGDLGKKKTTAELLYGGT